MRIEIGAERFELSIRFWPWMKRSLAQQRLLAVCGKLDEVVDRCSDAECATLIGSIASVVMTACAPPHPPNFEAMSLTELPSFDNKRHDRKRATKTFSLKAHDIWAADKSEAVEMVAAGWCEVVVMWEALRVILAWDDERDQVVWGQRIDEHVLERWFGLYCNISGLSGSSSSLTRRQSVFATVVNSVVTRSQARVVWSGQSGRESCDATECGNSDGTCDGWHLGLRV
jgi:hypothetical protein